MLVDITEGISIGGFWYEVDTSKEAHHIVMGNSNNGECDCFTHVIRLRNDMDEPQTSETFIHEIIEAVNHVYCNDKLEHEKISQLSYGIHQVMESLGVRFGKCH
jgi:hypothetical protein